MAAGPRTSPASAPPRRTLGFVDGVAAFFGGVGFILGKPSIWGYALLPTLAAAFLFGGFGALAIWGSLRFTPGGGEWNAAGVWGLRVVLWIAGVLLSFLLAVSFAQPVSGFALDVIARRQEVAAGGRTWPDQPLLASFLRSLGVTLTALAISLPLLGFLAAITFLFPPAGAVTVPLKLLVTSLAVAYDFLDYPLSLRGEGVRSRLGFIRQHFGAVVGFGAAGTMLLLIPGVGLLLLPFGVAGAARLVVKADAKAGARV